MYHLAPCVVKIIMVHTSIVVNVLAMNGYNIMLLVIITNYMNSGICALGF